jgi:hypothetical protein
MAEVAEVHIWIHVGFFSQILSCCCCFVGERSGSMDLPSRHGYYQQRPTTIHRHPQLFYTPALLVYMNRRRRITRDHQCSM